MKGMLKAIRFKLRAWLLDRPNPRLRTTIVVLMNERWWSPAFAPHRTRELRCAIWRHIELTAVHERLPDTFDVVVQARSMEERLGSPLSEERWRWDMGELTSIETGDAP